MNAAWSYDVTERSVPERAMIIRSKSIGPLTFGTCRRLEPILHEKQQGFWFLMMKGTRLHVTGIW